MTRNTQHVTWKDHHVTIYPTIQSNDQTLTHKPETLNPIPTQITLNHQHFISESKTLQACVRLADKANGCSAAAAAAADDDDDEDTNDNAAAAAADDDDDDADNDNDAAAGNDAIVCT